MNILNEPLLMNLDEKAPSPLPSPAEREREKGRQQAGNAAKFIGSMRENFFGEISPCLSPLCEERVAAGWARGSLATYCSNKTLAQTI